jgi:hypothetical protein
MRSCVRCASAATARNRSDASTSSDLFDLCLPHAELRSSDEVDWFDCALIGDIPSCAIAATSSESRFAPSARDPYQCVAEARSVRGCAENQSPTSSKSMSRPSSSCRTTSVVKSLVDAGAHWELWVIAPRREYDGARRRRSWREAGGDAVADGRFALQWIGRWRNPPRDLTRAP